MDKIEETALNMRSVLKSQLHVAEIAEENNHHPDMVVGWCKIDVAFTSHDQGGVTTACLDMAKRTELVL